MSEYNNDIAPEPTRENPGAVFPKFDVSQSNLAPTPPLSHQNSGTYIANPFLMKEAFGKLDHALGDVITILENEEQSASGSDNRLLRQFLNWRDQLDTIRTGRRTPSRSPARRSSPPQEGGLFVD